MLAAESVWSTADWAAGFLWEEEEEEEEEEGGDLNTRERETEELPTLQMRRNSPTGGYWLIWGCGYGFKKMITSFNTFSVDNKHKKDFHVGS